MIEFKVTGENAEEFARNALQAWGVLATGLQQLVQQQMQPAKLASDTCDGSTEKTPTTSVSTETSPPPIKPEEIKSRLAEVITAAAARGWAPSRRNAYAKQLLAFFRATGVSGIPTARYEEFMALSASYVTGTVNELLSDEIPF